MCACCCICEQHVHIKKSAFRLWCGDTQQSLQNAHLRFQRRQSRSFLPLWGVSPFRSETKSEKGFTHNSCKGSASLRTHRSASASSSRCAASGSAPHNTSVFETNKCNFTQFAHSLYTVLFISYDYTFEEYHPFC